jgi:type VI secretion system secreted protein Hcp
MTTTTPVDNTDFYLKIDGIKGETTIQGLTDYIRIASFNWGGQHSGNFQTAQGTGGASGRFSGGDFNFTMVTNAATPQLMSACAKGTYFNTATLVCRKTINGSPLVYLQVTLSPVLVSKFNTGYDNAISNGGADVVDNVSLNFGQIVVQYKGNTNTGSAGPAVEGGYNLQRGVNAG